jgi:putative tryptophan/tyrosine transport system substrate-binding protein
MMKRREFITLIGGAAAWPAAARAQQPERVREITVWMGRPNDAEGRRNAKAFREGLQAFGWTVGRNIRIDYHWVTRDIDRSHMANEIIEQRPDVIVVETTVGIGALSRESSTIPMIFVNAIPEAGFVASLARPGGNVTGFLSNEPTLGSKWPELLKEIAPETARIGFLFNPDTAPYAEPFQRHAEETTRLLGMELTPSRFHNDVEMGHAIASIASNRGGGLIVLPEPTTNARSEMIISMAARNRLPALFAYRYEVINGGLISYGVDIADLFQSAAAYVDRIFRGEKPADLPVQAATKFRLVVNLNTAKALGLTVPAATLLRADASGSSQELNVGQPSRGPFAKLKPGIL